MLSPMPPCLQEDDGSLDQFWHDVEGTRLQTMVGSSSNDEMTLSVWTTNELSDQG